MPVNKDNKPWDSLSIYVGIAIFFFSLLLRLFVRWMDPCISRDGCHYIQLAQIWSQSENGYLDILNDAPIGVPPLFLFVLTSLIHLGISAEISGIALNIIAGAVCPCLMYSITKEILPNQEKIAVSAAILTAVNPSMVALSIEPQRDMIYLFFCGCLCLLLLKSLHHNSWGLWCLAGGIFALSFLTRYETFEFLPIISLVLSFCVIKKGLSLKTAFADAILFLICSTTIMVIFLNLTGSQIMIQKHYKDFFEKKWAIVSEPELVE